MHFDIRGIFHGLLAAMLYASHLYITKKKLQSVHPINIALSVCVGSALLGLLFAYWQGTFVIPVGWTVYQNIFAIALIATVVPMLFILKGLQHVPASTAAMLSVLRPVVTLLFGALFLAELLNVKQVIGMVIVIGSILALQLKQEAHH
jgi:drug/metabolite transporter (DMT)-like permease